MSDPFFRPWVGKENVAAPAAPPPVVPHVNEQQQHRDQNELIIEPSGSQQRASTEQATVGNGNRETNFVSNQNCQNTSNTPEPPPAHTSQTTRKTSHDTATTSAASTSSVPLLLVTERHHLINPLPSQRTTTHCGYPNSLPQPYIPKKKLALIMSSPQYMQACVSVGMSTSATAGQYVPTPTPSQSFTTTDGYNNCTDAQQQTSAQSAVGSPLSQRTTATSVLTQTSQATNGHHLTTALQVNSNSITRPQTSASQSSLVTNGQHSTAPPTSHHYPTGGGRDTNSLPQLHMNQASSQSSVSATKPVSETIPMGDMEIENRDIWIDIETPEPAVWSPLQKSPATSFCVETSHNISAQHVTPPPPPTESSSAVEEPTAVAAVASQSSQITNEHHSTAPLSSQNSTPAEGYDTNSLPRLHTNQASEQSVPAAKPIFESNLSEKMEFDDEDEETRVNFQLPESAVSSPLEQSASTSALPETPDAGYDSNSLSQASNQLNITDTKTCSDTVPTEQDEDSWIDIESSESDTPENINGQNLTPPPSSQSSITVEAKNAESLPQPQFQQISEQPRELAGIPITQTDSTDSDIENKNPQENIQITHDREPKSPTPHTSRRPKSAESSPLAQNSAAVVRTETTHEQDSPPRCSKIANNNNTSSLEEPQRRRSARQSTRNSTKQSTQESTRQSTKRPKNRTTQQRENQSTGSPPPLIPSNGMACNLIFPNKQKVTWGTLSYGMNRSPLIRSIILATPPGNVPRLTIDQWQQGAKECESPTKNNTQTN